MRLLKIFDRVFRVGAQDWREIVTSFLQGSQKQRDLEKLRDLYLGGERDTEFLRAYSDVLGTDGQRQEALKVRKQILAPDSSDMLVLADWLTQTGDYAEARTYLESLLADNRQAIGVLKLLAANFSADKLHEQALEVLVRLLEIEPENTLWYKRASQSCQAMDRFGAALEFAERAWVLLPSQEHAVVMANVLTGLRRTQEALEWYGRAGELGPLDAKLLAAKAVLLRQTCAYSEALACFSAALEMKPTQISWKRAVAELALDCDHLEVASSQIEDLLSENQQDFGLWLLKGVYCYKCQKPGDGLEAFNNAVSLDRLSNLTASFRLVATLYQYGLKDLASAHYRKAQAHFLQDTGKLVYET